MEAIRLTPQVLAGQLIDNIDNQVTLISDLQEKISTGYKVVQPSEDPAEAVNIMQLQSAYARAKQYVKNAENGEAWLQSANSTLNSVLDELQKVSQVVESTDIAEDQGAQALNALATQVLDARQVILNLANTTYNGQAIFAGTANTTVAYNANGRYQGGGPPPTVTVASGVQVAIATTGPEVFGRGTTGLLSNTPGELGILAQIAKDLQDGNVAAATGTDLQNLQAAIANVEQQAAVVGAHYDHIQTLTSQAKSTEAAIEGELAGVQDINIAEATTNLEALQQSYQASLWATSTLYQYSLVSFLG
jgi:flagellar hook-associated protein 3 FlgL